MKVNNTVLYALAIGFTTCLVLISCSELVHTQVNPPKLRLEKSKLAANGTDQTLITAIMSNQLSTRQRLKFSTTNGKLLYLPQSSASVGSDSSILVNPGISEISVVLQSSLTPDEKVYVSASVGSFTTIDTVSFQRSCADEIIVEPTQTSFSLNETITLNLLFLRDDSKKVSINTRIDVYTDALDSVEYNSPLYSDALGTATLLIKSARVGNVNFKFADRSGCNTQIQDKLLTIKQ